MPKIIADGRDMTHEEWQERMRKSFRVQQEADAMWAEVFSDMNIPYSGLIDDMKANGTYHLYEEAFTEAGEKM